MLKVSCRDFFLPNHSSRPLWGDIGAQGCTLVPSRLKLEIVYSIREAILNIDYPYVVISLQTLIFSNEHKDRALLKYVQRVQN